MYEENYFLSIVLLRGCLFPINDDDAFTEAQRARPQINSPHCVDAVTALCAGCLFGVFGGLFCVGIEFFCQPQRGTTMPGKGEYPLPRARGLEPALEWFESKSTAANLGETYKETNLFTEDGSLHILDAGAEPIHAFVSSAPSPGLGT
uniref:Uncharacterized protein n=1 Tax=Anopheles maculatus TaxID=74869 RepID=A0A182SWY9_9DIPT